MHGRDDFDQLMRWGERLRLYGQVQGVYYEQLREQGFDSEQAFQLVREWTARTVGWTTDAEPIVPSHADFFQHLAEAADPTLASDDEDYLIPAPEPPSQPPRPADAGEGPRSGPPSGIVHELRPRKRRGKDAPAAADEDAGDEDSRSEDAA